MYCSLFLSLLVSCLVCSVLFDPVSMLKHVTLDIIGTICVLQLCDAVESSGKSGP